MMSQHRRAIRGIEAMSEMGSPGIATAARVKAATAFAS